MHHSSLLFHAPPISRGTIEPRQGSSGRSLHESLGDVQGQTPPSQGYPCPPSICRRKTEKQSENKEDNMKRQNPGFGNRVQYVERTKVERDFFFFKTEKKWMKKIGCKKIEVKTAARTQLFSAEKNAKKPLSISQRLFEMRRRVANHKKYRGAHTATKKMSPVCQES